MKKRMKSKGYAKGGAKMMKSMRGKMAKGYAKGGAKMMKAMGGRMMAKGMAKGGKKMMRASAGAIAKITKAARAREEGGRFSVNDLRMAAKSLGYNIAKKTNGKKTPAGPQLFVKKKK